MFGFWGNSEEVFFVDEFGNGYRLELSEYLYQAILGAIRTASPANRENAKKATIKDYKKWSSPALILSAAQHANIDVRAIIKQLSQKNTGSQHNGTGSTDDGYIYILKHANHAIVKIGKTKATAAERAINYANNHDDPDGWSVYHQVPSQNVSAVEARIHSSLESSRAAYGYNAKEVFAISVTFAMKVVYREIEL